jgi:hypothetical protein
MCLRFGADRRLLHRVSSTTLPSFGKRSMVINETSPGDVAFGEIVVQARSPIVRWVAGGQ